MDKIFGYELILDLFDCDIEKISSKKELKEYTTKLCELIEMEKFGKTLTPYFGLQQEKTKGYSLLQFIETSSITGHFSEYFKCAYINIFSCKTFNKKTAKDFTKSFFKAKKIKSRFIVR